MNTNESTPKPLTLVYSDAPRKPEDWVKDGINVRLEADEPPPGTPTWNEFCLTELPPSYVREGVTLNDCRFNGDVDLVDVPDDSSVMTFNPPTLENHIHRLENHIHRLEQRIFSGWHSG